ncbi:Caskin-2 [Trichoplax sp. H2]|nr:Caskin-2 [Trichoplax sp. H2]|eukprot:RDD41863.1 Caskin-2 [Trichoplax sp. H2]
MESNQMQVKFLQQLKRKILLSLKIYYANNNSALQKCVYEDDTVGVELLLKNGADPLYENPSHFVAVEGNKDVLEWLLNQKVDVDARDGDGYTTLHLAVWEGHIDCVRLLLRNNASLNAVSKGGQKAHDMAVEVGRSEIVDILVKAESKYIGLNANKINCFSQCCFQKAGLNGNH